MHFGHFGTFMLHCYFHIFVMFRCIWGWELIEDGEKVFAKKFQELRMRNGDFKMSSQECVHDSCQAMPKMDTSRVQDWPRRFLSRHESCHLTRVVSLLKLPKISFSKFVNWEFLDTFRGQTGLETLQGRFSEKASIRIIWNHVGNNVTLNL